MDNLSSSFTAICFLTKGNQKHKQHSSRQTWCGYIHECDKHGVVTFTNVTNMVWLHSRMWQTWCGYIHECDKHGVVAFMNVTNMVWLHSRMWQTWCGCIHECDKHGVVTFTNVTNMVWLHSRMWQTWCGYIHECDKLVNNCDIYMVHPVIDIFHCCKL